MREIADEEKALAGLIAAGQEMRDDWHQFGSSAKEKWDAALTAYRQGITECHRKL